MLSYNINVEDMFNFCANMWLFLPNGHIYFKFRSMEENCLNIEALLEFYEMSGVDETCGDFPFIIEQKEKETEAASSDRVAVSHLAIAAKDALKTADDLCANRSGHISFPIFESEL